MYKDYVVVSVKMPMWVVCKIQDFELEVSPNQAIKLPFPIVVERGKMLGFLPIYETEEDAHAEFPDTPLVRMVFARAKEVKR